MIKDKKEILIKGYIVSVFMLIIAFGVVYKLVNLQVNEKEREKFEEFAQKTNFRTQTIPAERGNLYAADGSLLASSVRHYNIAIDGKSMRQELIDQDLGGLSDSLSALLGKPSSYYSKLILNAKKKQKQYVRIANKLTYRDMARLKAFPIFNKGQIKGGLIIEDKLIRVRSIRDIGPRTLGYANDSVKVGLEGAYNTFLAGKNGSRLEQRMGGGNWKPINIFTEIDAEEGYDVHTTIDVGLQNVAYNALYEQLSEYEADHGSVVVMDVKTGEVRAIVNLTRLADGNYADIQNFAVGEANEPGSTIKTVSLLAALDAGVIDTATTIATGGGRYRLYGRTISDSHGYGTINVRQVLEKSSNIGTARLITNVYQKDPEDFIDILTDQFKLDQPLGVDIPGEAKPYIPNPDNKSWSKQSLSSISYGYETKLTPLQILAFYNGIANNGVMLKPLFVKEIKHRGKTTEKFEPQIRIAKMAEDSSIQKIQNMLESVVKHGTGRALYNPDFPAAGKTGTARAEYWIKNQPMQYRASFVGYYPVDNPQYSCIVVVHKPSRKKGFYGGSVAGPVFKKIMEKVFINSPRKFPINDSVHVANQTPNHFELKPNQKTIPNLLGKNGYEVVPAMENLGLTVKYSGIGRVQSQSIQAGTKITKNQTIYLQLGG